MNEHMKIFVYFSPMKTEGYELWARYEYPDGSIGVLVNQPLEWKLLSRREYADKYEGMRHEPLLTFGEGSARMLMDSLWNSGIRPSDDVASTGQIGAMEGHIESLRRVLGIDG